MRLGGPVFGKIEDPECWVRDLRAHGYSAAYCPLEPDASGEQIRAFRDAAAKNNVVISEVGAWSNPLSLDTKTREAAIANCQKRLALADQISARCCVNIAGSLGSKWDGPHAADMTGSTFDLIVQTVRMIIDAVEPSRSCYSLEPMPWMYPDSPDSYLDLIRAIDRRQFAVHLDVANMINCPSRFFCNAAFIRDCFEKLGPHIKSCHAKDVQLIENCLPVHLQEVRPGLGKLDYITFLHEADRLDPDTPIMLEHLATAEEYDLASAYLRIAADEAGVVFQ